MIRKVIRTGIYVLLASILLLVIVLAAMYFHTPDWYRPTKLSDDQITEATSYLIGEASALNKAANDLPDGQLFSRTFKQDRLSSYLQTLPRFDQRAKMPDWLTDPVIVLKPDRVILAGRVAKLSNRPVSLHLAMRVESDRLVVELVSVDVGSMPLPRQLVHDQLGELRQQVAPAARPDSDRTSKRGSADKVSRQLAGLVPALLAAVEGEPMARTFATPEKRQVRLEKVDIRDGEMTLTFRALGEPLPKRPEAPEE